MMAGTRDTYENDKRFLPQGRGSSCGATSPAALQRDPEGNRNPRSRWSRTSRSARRPRSRSRTSRTTTSSRACRTGAGSRRCSSGDRPGPPARPRRRRHLPGPRQLQARERQPGPQRRRRAARPARRRVWRPPGRPTWWRARAATSSSCCSPDLEAVRDCPGPTQRCSSPSRCRPRARALPGTVHPRGRRVLRHGIDRHQPFPRDAVDARRCCSNADTAMYRSKKAGPGGYGRLRHRREDPMLRLRHDHQLRRAVERRELGAALSADRGPRRRPHPGRRGADPWQEPNGGI